MSESRYEEALRNPRSVYRNPPNVLADDTLTHAQKREVLQHWQAEAVHIQESEGEGLQGGEASQLDEVTRALRELDANAGV